MADRYFRLVCFVMNICPDPLRELFINLAKKDSGSSYTTIDSYLTGRHPEVKQLKTKRKIRQDQYDLLYPGNGTADINQWDVTLLSTLVTELFPANLQAIELFYINEIRAIRNQLQHLPNTTCMSNEDFDGFWERLDSASTTLAGKVFDDTRKAKFRQSIEDAKLSHLPDLETIRKWYEETIRQMADTIQDIESKLDDVHSNTREATSILRKVTVEKPGPSGDKNKRLKTADNILARLQANFETTMGELPETFAAPPEVSDIRTRLRDYHHVVVTGSYNSRYLETALAAIKGMDYNHKRCVEMQISSDWRHIDPEDVDLVLCRNPFGNFSYDESKSKSIADLLDSMIISTNGCDGKFLHIVMITDYKVLTDYKQFHDHDFLDQLVKVFDNTSESQPADLTLGYGNQKVNYLPFANNLSVMTSNFLKQYEISSGQVDEDILQEARNRFKAKKAIVLTGPRKCGKTSLAVALANSYQPSQCSILTEPNDFKKIDFQNTCLIIIDEFAGKYCYKENNVFAWYDMFEHLYNAVTAGQMNVIITCEKSKLEKCCSEISQHPILEHRVEITKHDTVLVKQEIGHHFAEHTAEVLDIELRGIDETFDSLPVVISNGSLNRNHSTETQRLPQTVTAHGSTTPMQNIQIDSRNLLPAYSKKASPSRRMHTRMQNIQTGARNFLLADIARKLPSTRRLIEKEGQTDALLIMLSDYSLLQRFLLSESNETSLQNMIGPTERTMKIKQMSNIRTNQDSSACCVLGCCILPSGEILLADYNNNRLKKLSNMYQVISACNLASGPCDVCYIGNNIAVVATLAITLYFVDISWSMTVTKTVSTGHVCTALACHDNHLYVTGLNSVYLHGTDGIKQRVLYTYNKDHISFQQIAISKDGNLICLVGYSCGLVMIDRYGNHLDTLNYSVVGIARGVCIDDDGNALVCTYIDTKSQILQISFDGRRIAGIKEFRCKSIDHNIIKTLCFCKGKRAVLSAGYSDNITVLEFQT